MALYLCGLPPKTHNPSLIKRRTSDKCQLRGILQLPDQYSLMFQSHQKQGKLEKPVQPRGAQGDIAKYDVTRMLLQKKNIRQELRKSE